MTDDVTYLCSLSEFVDKTIKRWAKQKSQYLEPKFQANYEAITNRDNRLKKWKKDEGKGWRSNTWVGFVRVKVWAFYSVLLDTVLRAGKIPFNLTPHPYDNDQDEEYIQDRDARIELQKKKIETQLALRKADREYMKKWLSLGWYGMAFSKFNIDTIKSKIMRRVQMLPQEAAGLVSPEEQKQYIRYQMSQESETVPGHKYVSVWNMVWDMEGENLQESAGYADVIRSSSYDLKQLKGLPGYFDQVIDNVIKANSQKVMSTRSAEDAHVLEQPGKRELQERRATIVRYEFYMRAPRKLVEEFEKIMKKKFKANVMSLGDYEDSENSGDDIEIMGEIADKQIIRYLRNDTGKRPHHMCVMEQDLDETTGTGIADNMADVQSALVGMIRAFEDNKKLSANVTTAVKKRYFHNPDQLNDIVPGKSYDIADDCDDVRKAILPVVFPDVGESLMSGISLMMQMKDDVSMIPTIMQGFNLAKHQPDTAYEMRQLTENAGKYIGQVIRNCDEQFIEPEIWDIYEYNMMYGDDEQSKVTCKVEPNGFTSFQNKEIRGERMRMALSMFISSEILFPYCEVRPHLEIIYESMDENPERFIKTEEKMAEESQAKAEAQAQAEMKAIQMNQALADAQAERQAKMFAFQQQGKMAEGQAKHGQEIEKAVVDAKLKIAVEDAKKAKEGDNEAE